MELTNQLQQQYQQVYDKMYAIVDRDSYVIGQEIDQQTNMLFYVIRLGEVIVWQYAVDVNIIPVITQSTPHIVTVSAKQTSTGQ